MERDPIPQGLNSACIEEQSKSVPGGILNVVVILVKGVPSDKVWLVVTMCVLNIATVGNETTVATGGFKLSK
jgi:hypothetical protein